MARPNRSAADDHDLQTFYEACGIDSKTIERAIEHRYVEPPRTYRRDTDIAKRMRREPVAPKMRRLRACAETAEKQVDETGRRRVQDQ